MRAFSKAKTTFLTSVVLLAGIATAAPVSATDPAQGCADGSAVTKYVGGIAFNSSGDLLMSNVGGRNILKVQHGSRVVTLVAGSGTTSFAALDNFFDQRDPMGMATDSTGNIFIYSWERIIYKIDTSGQGSIFAGTGASGYSGDGGPATQATFTAGYGWGQNNITTDSSGNVFISDPSNNVVRMIDRSGIISTVIGGSANRPQMTNPGGITSDSHGNIYVYDGGEDLILKRDAAGAVSVFASLNTQPTQAQGIASDADGNIYFQTGNSDGMNRVDHATGAISMDLRGSTMPHGTLAVNSVGNVFIGSPDLMTVTQFNPTSGAVSTYAGVTREFGQGGVAAFVPSGTPANFVSFNYSNGLGVDTSGNIYFSSNGWTHHVAMVDSATSQLSYPVGAARDSEGFSGDGTSATSAKVKRPTGIGIDDSENLYFIDQDNQRVRKVTKSTGVISTVAGNGVSAYTTGSSYAGITDVNANRDIAIAQEGTPAVAAELFLGDSTNFVDVDSAGNIYVTNKTDVWGSLSRYGQIRKITTDGKIHTIAGNGTSSYVSSMDNHAATDAGISTSIQGLVVDRSTGDVYFSDNKMIHKIHNDTITTVATFLQTNQAGALALNPSAQTLYFYDTVNSTIGSINLATTPATVSPTVLAGGGVGMYAPNGSAATSLAIASVEQMVFAPQTNELYFSGRFYEIGTQYANNVASHLSVQSIDLAHNTISTKVGYVPTVPAGGTSFGCVVYTSVPTITVGTGGSQSAAIPSLATTAVFSDVQLGNAVMRFSAVSSAASVTIAPVSNPATAAATPFVVSGTTKIVDIQVTGVNGDVTVCLDGAPTDHLFHYTGGAWVDLPQRTYVDGQVCGVTTSFSPFAAALPQAPVQSPPASSGSPAVAEQPATAPSSSLGTPAAASAQPVATPSNGRATVQTIGAKKLFVAKNLAKLFDVKIVSPKAAVSIAASRSTAEICTMSGARLKTLNAGSCTVTFTVQEPTPKNGKKPRATSSKKTLIIS
ncbi:MAG: hypothetical protein RL352_361 [Actinomycetota bacterium]